LPLEPDDTGVCNFKLFVFTNNYGTPVGDARVPTVPPAVASVEISPRVLGGCGKPRWIRSIIRLPDGYDVTAIQPDSLRLSVPSCPDCESISVRWGRPLKPFEGFPDPRYFAFFPGREFIDRVDGLYVQLPASIDVRVSGYMLDGRSFEGDAAVRVTGMWRWRRPRWKRKH
jgi:hypothetical protein